MAVIFSFPEGRRLNNLNSARDIQWLLQYRGVRDDHSKMSTNALRLVILLLPPAAKSFVRKVIKGAAAWGMFKRQELPRSSRSSPSYSYQGRDSAFSAVAPAPLPPLPSIAPSDSRTSRRRRCPLRQGFLAGVNFTCSWIWEACHNQPRGAPNPHANNS